MDAADLAAVDRARTPWVVVATHRPLYISSTSTGGVWDDQDVAAVLRAQLEALRERDVIGLAQTGSGKTGAFALPILQSLLDAPQGFHSLILSPTRELAMQIAEQIETLGAGVGARTATVGPTGLGPLARARMCMIPGKR